MLTSGKVKEVCCRRMRRNSPFYFIKAIVGASMTKGIFLKPWVLLNTDGEPAGHGKVIHAHCTCVAGMQGSCNHVTALLYMVEILTYEKSAPACTEVKCAWLPPSMPKGGFKPGPVSATPICVDRYGKASTRAKRQKQMERLQANKPYLPQSGTDFSLPF